MPTAVTLVTGASGFLGAAIMHRLKAQGQDAVGLDPRASDTVQIIDDLTDLKRLQKLLREKNITHVIHAGGISGPMVMQDNAAGVIAINVQGSLNLLNAALASSVKTFVYCSSVASLGNYYEHEPITESYPPRPESTYACSKAAMDMILRGLWKKVPLDLCSLQLTAIYGPGRQTRFIIDEIVAGALTGRPAKIGPMTDWPFIYIDDAAEATIAACFSSTRNQLTYFIAHPQKVTAEDIAAAAMAAGKPVRLEIDDRIPLAARGPVDIEAAARDFAFRAKVGHREGIRRMIDTIPSGR
jgi:nucleoside-diphosphate-sugar epimerase